MVYLKGNRFMTATPFYCPTCGAANSADESVCFACDRRLDQVEEERADEFLLQGRYQVLSQVGIGGFGAVYRARDGLKGHEVVAVKQINLRGLSSQETIEATDGFNREVQLLSTLSHEHLPRIHDHFTDTEHWYLVMDFIEGQTLERYLVDEAVSRQAIRMLSFDEILHIGLQLCDVLAYLHTRQPVIIFRDLKPSNIMRTPTGKLYLIDFGIARRFTPGKLKDTIPLGSPGYAAPEQYGKAQTTPRADIYSLGALLHHLLSGADPADNPFSFAPLRLYGSTGLAELEAMIHRMIALDAGKRLGSIAEVKEELQRIVGLRSKIEQRIWHPPISQNLPGVNQASPYWQTPSFGSQAAQGTQGVQGQQQTIHVLKAPPSSRRKLIVNGLAIGAGLLIGGGPVLSALNTHLQRDRHGLYATEIEKDIYKYSSPVKALSWSPSGDYLAVTANSSTLYVWNTRNWMRHPISTDMDTLTSLSWSPDNKLLALTDDATLQVLAVRHNSTRYQPEGIGSSSNNSALWSPNGNYLALASSDGSLNILDTSDPRNITLLNTYKNIPANKDKVLLSWSPDSSLIAVNARHMIQVRAASIGTIASSLGPPESDPIAMSWSPNGSGIATANGDSRAQLWDQQTGKLLADYDITDDSSASITDLAWSPGGRYLAATATNGKVYFWDTQQHQSRPFTSYNAIGSAATLIAWSPQDPRIAVSYDDGRCIIWKAPSAI
jgi:serine/threonine protein kinase